MALWTPQQAETALWLDAADPATLSLNAEGSAIQWNDKSGKGRNASASVSTGVPISPSALENPSLYFDGGRRFTVPFHPDFSSEGGISVIGVVRYNSSELNRGWIGKWGNVNTPGENDWVHTNASTGAGQIAGVTLPGAEISLAAHPPSMQAHLWGMIIDPGTALSNFKDGVAVSVPLDQVQGSTSGSLAIGSYSRFGGAVDFIGWVGEIVIVQGAAPLDLWTKIEGYLAHRWFIEDQLQSDHPYRLFPPGATLVSGRAIDTLGRKAERGILFDWNLPHLYQRLDIGPQGEWEAGADGSRPFGIYYHFILGRFMPTVHGPYLLEQDT